MDATTPLLRDQQGMPMPVGYAQVQDHPIFLRACHSPWTCLNQNILTYIRGFLVLYLTAVGAMLIDFKINREDEHNAWRLLWQFSSISFGLLWLYHVIVFCWTFTHLHYPDIDANDRRFESVLLRGMSPPQQTANSRGRFYFSMFYTAAHAFCFMNTLIFWAVLVPNGHGHLPHQDPPAGYPDDIFADGWFKPFCIFNLWAGTALVALIEIFFLNSIKRQVPVPSHIFGLMFLCSCYLGWAAFGRMLTGHNPFFWMDPKVVGYREAVAAYCAGFVALSPAVFCFMYGIIGMRENVTKKDDRAGQANQRQYIQQ